MYQCNLEVRGYELDSFNHVDNAVYLNYYEHARWQILRRLRVAFPVENEMSGRDAGL